MKILYLYKALAVWGGIERILIDKMNYLSSCFGYQIYMVTTDQGLHRIPYKMDEEIVYKDLNIRFHTQYALPRYKRIFEKIRLQHLFEQRLQETIQEIQPDIIVCMADLYVSTLVKYKRRIPMIVESHSMKCYTALPGCRSLNWWRKLNRRIYFNSFKKAQAIVTLTQGDALEWGELNDEISVIPNVVHLNPTLRYSTHETKRVIFVGRFAYQKGIDDLIKIWSIVQQRHSDWQLDLYGEGEWKEKYVQVIDSYPNCLNMNIHEPTHDIFDRYIESSIFILTSIYEPFGLVIPEAMSCGLPVVSFNCPYGPADIITDSEDGFLIENRDIQDFANKICVLMENRDLRKQMGEKAIVKAQKYAPENIMPMWKELFEKLVN